MWGCSQDNFNPNSVKAEMDPNDEDNQKNGLGGNEAHSYDNNNVIDTDVFKKWYTVKCKFAEEGRKRYAEEPATKRNKTEKDAEEATVSSGTADTVIHHPRPPARTNSPETLWDSTKPQNGQGDGIPPENACVTKLMCSGRRPVDHFAKARVKLEY